MPDEIGEVMTDLTYSEAVEMLGRLKGKVVLGEWQRNARDNEYIRFNLVTGRLYCDVFKSDNNFKDSNRKAWIAGISNMGNAIQPGVQYKTAKEAMDVIDAVLRTLPNVVAAGIH